MADITITDTSCVPAASVVYAPQYPFGETVTAGMVVYLKASDSKWYKAVATSGGTAEQSGSGVVMGIAMCGGAASQPGVVAVGGTVTIGGTLAAGVFYYVSQTLAGKFSLPADLGSGDYVSIIGYATTTAILKVAPVATGLTLA